MKRTANNKRCISNNKISEDTDKLEERIKDKFRLVGVEQ